MEAKAIQLIQDTAVLAYAKPLGTHQPALVLPHDQRIHSIEHFGATRSRFRGALSTHSLNDFGDYVTQQSEANAAVGFVNAEGMACTVFFNLGNTTVPGHGDFTATLNLRKTAAFKALERAAGATFEQKDLSDWIEDWAPNLIATDIEGAEIDLRKAASAIRSISIEQARNSEHTVGDLSAARSAMEKIEAKSAEGLPAGFTFTTEPYEGLQPRTITLRVAVLTGGDKPRLKLRWIGEEQLREDLAQEFKDVVQEEVGTAATLTIGSFELL
ncbi:DUF2303 family protein [Pseudomonas sp. GW531-T4]|uniref:DUF2303 family protein n=1 Tax=Pseudomonas sp. GW531-T4 TaxID=2075553 RepID=UPI000CD32060|nr:DUF2303 family protein [Pseudomonas sp. GW531-T4]POA75378.1 hypothetical protein C1888_00300 [Pseudomonas sp. GW531-T4]